MSKKKPEKDAPTKPGSMVRKIIMSHNTPLVSLPLEVKRKMGLGKGTKVELSLDDASGVLSMRVVEGKVEYPEEKPSANKELEK